MGGGGGWIVGVGGGGGGEMRWGGGVDNENLVIIQSIRVRVISKGSQQN